MSRQLPEAVEGLRKALEHILPNVCFVIHFSSFEEILNILLE